MYARTHYSIVTLDSSGQVESGMYTSSDAYATPELARQLGPAYFENRKDSDGKPKRLALVAVETTPEGDSRRMVSRIVLDMVEGPSKSLKMVKIYIGSIVIECEEGLAAMAGYAHPYADDEQRRARGGDRMAYGSGMRLTPDQAVCIALSEGLIGEKAVRRAVALRSANNESANANAERVAAENRNHAAQAELRAEQIRSERSKREEEKR